MKNIIGFLIVSVILTTNIFAENPVDEKVNFLPEKYKAKYFFDRGLGYYNLYQYSNALEFLKQALEIQSTVLPENHPDLLLTKSMLESYK